MMDFTSIEYAFNWMERQIDDDCIDNHRHCFMDDPNGIIAYKAIAAEGCCGVFEIEITINGQPALVGCNYGH